MIGTLRAKQFNKTALALALLALSGYVWSQQPQPAKIEKIEVTGSNIKRIDAETPSPVQIITREEIERSGYSTVSEVLRSLPSNNINSFNESFVTGFTPGASAVSLRGLGPQASLILLNGRRITNFGFAFGTQTTFVDLNSIPLSAVERVEVLKDGASAIYGSDAVAGVVNIITRRDYRGAEARVSYGMSSERDTDTARAVVTAGIGNLAKDRYNLFFNLEHLDREHLFARDRDYTSTQDLRSIGYRNLRTVASFPGTFQAVPGTNPGFMGRRAATGCPPDRVLNNQCLADSLDFLTMLPEVTRSSIYSRLAVDISDKLSFFTELAYLRNKTEFHIFPVFLPSTWLRISDLTLQGINPLRLPQGHPSNPFPAPIDLFYSFDDIGARVNQTTTKNSRAVAGLKGNWRNWDWESAVGYNKSDTEALSKGEVNAAVFREVLADRSYFFGDRSRNSDSLYARLSPNIVRTGITTMKFVDFKTSGDIWQLPHGALSVAAGGEYRKETLDDRPDALIQSGNIIGRGATSARGDRNVTAFYGEVIIPAFRNLEIQAALRTDNYSDYGRSTTPKLGVKWAPVKSIALRGTYAEGFRAPSLPEISESASSVFQSGVLDARRCNATGAPADCNGQVPVLIGANPDLQPEDSRSYTVGLVFEPFNAFSAIVDYYNIRRKEQIARFSTSFLIGNEDRFPGQVVRGARLPNDPPGIPGPVQFVISRYVNLAETVTTGLDVDLLYRLNSPLGRFSAAARSSYIYAFKLGSQGGTLPNFVGTLGLPRYRGNFQISWLRQPWQAALTANYINRFAFSSSPTPNSCALLNITPPFPSGCEIKAWTTLDFFTAYDGFKNWRLSLSVQNLQNKRAPLDLNQTTTVNSLHNAIGRFFTVAVQYNYR